MRLALQTLHRAAGDSGRLVQPEGMALDSLLVESLELCMLRMIPLFLCLGLCKHLLPSGGFPPPPPSLCRLAACYVIGNAKAGKKALPKMDWCCRVRSCPLTSCQSLSRIS